MKRFLCLFLVFITGIILSANFDSFTFGKDLNHSFDVNALKIKIKMTPIVLSNIPFRLYIEIVDNDGRRIKSFPGPVSVFLKTDRLYVLSPDGKKEELNQTVNLKQGEVLLENLIVKKSGNYTLCVTFEDISERIKIRVLPGIISILPPALAIFLALTLRQVIISLFCGVWLGATFIQGYNPLLGLLRVMDKYMVEAIADNTHIAIIIFSLSLGGMVGILSKSGSMQGLVDCISRKAKNAKTGQLATLAMGLFIFFDDYANTLLVGNTMRSLTDKLRISREKLSYLVDSTAAPVANIAIISTWIGFEIGLINDGFRAIGLDRNAYLAFVESIPYRFYPILTIIFVFFVSWMLRDFSAMYYAEKRARITGEVNRPGAKPLSDIEYTGVKVPSYTIGRWFNALIPIFSVIFFTLWGLWYSGKLSILQDPAKGSDYLVQAPLYEVLGAANSPFVLVWASLGGSIVAGIMVVAQRIFSISEAVDAWVSGVKSIVIAVIILVLAWSIGDICKYLHTAEYVSVLAQGNISPHLLPLLSFVLSAVISFATGTSWATMSILMPIAIYTGYYLPPVDMPLPLKNAILLGTISGVLAGATFGDHCSPISDTTIMSSMASAADHIDHVKTQIPYAITVAMAGIFLGIIPAGYGINPWICLGVCSVALFLILRFIGRSTDPAILSS